MAFVQRYGLEYFTGGTLNFTVWHCGPRFLILEISKEGLTGLSSELMLQNDSDLYAIQTDIFSKIIRASNITSVMSGERPRYIKRKDPS